MHWRFISLICAAKLAVELATAGPLIVDHTAVAKCQYIPSQYIAAVKTMWLNVPGESHSSGYRIGCELLEQEDSRFQVNVRSSGTPEGGTDAYLRVSGATWGDVSNPTGWRYSYGEEDWYTSTTAVQRTLAHLSYANTNGFPIAAMGFGWCWDMTWQNGPDGGTDPVYRVRWAGSSVGGPDGNRIWGLDAEDYVLTSNSVCMDTYLNATRLYMEHCRTSGFTTVVFFTTGPVDGGGNTGERGYQRHLKHEYIRSYVASLSNGVLFDYADILCWSNNEQNLVSWKDYGGTTQYFQYIHSDNMLDLDGTYTEDGDHIGQRGALRLAKGLWYMLACLAGWDGVPRTSQGVPHEWLDRHGLVTNGYEDAALSDTDHDGHAAWQEYIADTDPTDSNSVLRATALAHSSPITVSFVSSTNRVYTLQGITNLVHGSWSNVLGAGPRQGVGGSDSMQDTNEPPQGPFYRMEVQLP